MYVVLFSNNSHSIRMKQFTIEIPSLNRLRKFFPTLRLVANRLIESRFRKAIKFICWKHEACPMSHHLCQSGAIQPAVGLVHGRPYTRRAVKTEIRLMS